MSDGFGFKSQLCWGFPVGWDGKESACDGKNSAICLWPGFDPQVRKILWRRKWQPTPVFLTGKFHGQKSLAGCSPWGCRDSDVIFTFFFHPALGDFRQHLCSQVPHLKNGNDKCILHRVVRMMFKNSDKQCPQQNSHSPYLNSISNAASFKKSSLTSQG